MNKINIWIMLIISSFILITPFASAHCPLCTAGAIAGIGVARSLGVSDSIVGLFLGAFIVSTALWFNRWLKKKKINYKFQGIALIILSFLLLVVPLYFAGVITNFNMVRLMPQHHAMLGLGILGIDKLLTGTILGTLAVLGSFSLSDKIKKIKGKVLWPYQGISFMFITLAILSFIFWLVTK